LLDRDVRDVDLVIEGDAGGFARALAERLGARHRAHGHFGTAVIELPSGERIDVAATRRETYSWPGALPDVVEGGPIGEDLSRRDFTVNAMALEVQPRRRLVDPFGGRADLAAGRIRFLHPRSPQDDPTRAVRAVRYANRLGFRIAPEARLAMAAAIGTGAFRGVSGDRLRRELSLLLSEERRGRAVARLVSLGLAAAISPALVRPGASRRLLAAELLARRRRPEPGWLCYLFAWMGDARIGTLERLADRLGFAGRDRSRLLSWPRARRLLGAGFADRLASHRFRRVEGLEPEERVAAAALASPRDRRAILAIGEPPALTISGTDLVVAGVPPGPRIGIALARTRAAREDGRIGPDEELAFALRAARVR
jgi:tRNA nucleotidyltransferase (CCA-adding enzyme)